MLHDETSLLSALEMRGLGWFVCKQFFLNVEEMSPNDPFVKENRKVGARACT